MWWSATLFGGVPRASFAEDITAMLVALGEDIVTTELVPWHRRYDWCRPYSDRKVPDGPSQAYGGAVFVPPAVDALDSATTSQIHTYGARHPAWHAALARRATELLGAAGIVTVNDRLFSEYGYAAFFAGATLEAVSVFLSDVRLRCGVDPGWPDARIASRYGEDENRARFAQDLRALLKDGPEPRIPDDAPTRCIALAPRSETLRRTAFNAAAPEPAFVHAVFADVDATTVRGALAPGDDTGWTFHEHILERWTDDWMEEVRRPYVVARSAATARLPVICGAAEALDATFAAIVVAGHGHPSVFRSRTRGAGWRIGEGRGLASLLDALAPVCAQLDIAPLLATQAPARDERP
jgi:hypothetical protein